MRRIILINLVVVLAIVVVACVAGYLLYNNYYFYSTDDAQVTGNIVNIVSTTPGTLNSLTIQIGDNVSANQVVGTVQITGSNAIANLTAPFSGLIVQVPGVAFTRRFFGNGGGVAQKGSIGVAHTHSSLRISHLSIFPSGSNRRIPTFSSTLIEPMLSSRHSAVTSLMPFS